jgi:Transposase IS66 family
MDPAPESLPDDVAALKAALNAERARRLEVAAELVVAQAKASEDMALIAAQKLRIAKLERQVFGQRSERSARLKASGKKEIPLSPIAIEVVRRIDALFAIERSISGKSPEERLAVRRAVSRPLVDDLMTTMREQAARLSRGHDLAKAIQYMLKRWSAFTLFLDDGRVCMSTDDAEKRESSARRSGLGRSLGRLFLPRRHHSLVGLLSTPHVVGFSLADLPDPIVATWSRLAIFARGTGFERGFA